MERASDPLLITIQLSLINVLCLRFVELVCKCSVCESKPFVKGDYEIRGMFLKRVNGGDKVSSVIY